MKNEQPSLQALTRSDIVHQQRYRVSTRERTRAALVLLLGDDTGIEARFQAARRLARQGPTVLPTLLETLDRCPEFSVPSWPWWPPQYEQCGRLLLQLSRAAQTPLDLLLQHPVVSQPAGPVLWTSLIEAAARAPRDGYESLLRAGLQAPWRSTCYAAAVALGDLAGIAPLSAGTIEALRACQCAEFVFPLRLVASHALLRHSDSHGLAGLIALLDASIPDEMRKAAAFVLASESPLRTIDARQRSQLLQWAVTALQDRDADIGLYAADILGGIAALSTLPLLCPILTSSNAQAQIAALSVLEGVAAQKALHLAVYQCALPAQIVKLLRSDIPEVRRQAAYTLAAFGGAYATAALGTMLLNDDQCGRIEAIEGVRLLPGALRPQRRKQIARWLLHILREAAASLSGGEVIGQEEAQVTALDSLAYLALQARRRGRHAASRALSETTWNDGTAQQLLTSASAWVRQRAIEFLGMLDGMPSACLAQINAILHNDDDSGVRACAAYILGQMNARRAIPDLILALLDPDENVAETALNTLGRLASPDDYSVVYVLRELAVSFGKKKRAGDQLARTARAVLRELGNS
ncbi:MAG: HEAT repeat domain-containing protein [Ktedonobacteraceae bacterium]